MKIIRNCFVLQLVFCIFLLTITQSTSMAIKVSHSNLTNAAFNIFTKSGAEEWIVAQKNRSAQHSVLDWSLSIFTILYIVGNHIIFCTRSQTVRECVKVGIEYINKCKNVFIILNTLISVWRIFMCWYFADENLGLSSTLYQILSLVILFDELRERFGKKKSTQHESLASGKSIV